MSNEIKVSGKGQIISNQVVAGEHASAVLNIADQAGAALEKRGLGEIREKLDVLIDAITKSKEKLDNADDVLTSTEMLAKEMQKPKPSKLTLSSLLDGIAHSVGSVTSIAGAALTLKTAIVALL